VRNSEDTYEEQETVQWQHLPTCHNCVIHRGKHKEYISEYRYCTN